MRPILSAHCFSCHGPDEAGRKAELRLDQRDAALETLQPGKPEESELLARVLSDDHDLIMPPVEAKKPLSDEQREILKRWIEQGAPYEQHWSFVAPQKVEPPAVRQAGWVRNSIDPFVLARLEAAGLTPSPEAARPTLIRRVALDLNGVPPTLEELQRFAATSDENWYEQMVDYYLAKPAFGERMALNWLDAARYGDTSVFHADGPRDMWPWRDWVINAYNSNMPFDQFTIEQLAGDLLPNPTPHQQIASGFNRHHATTDEGGAIAEEWRVDYVVDRVKTTSNVWLGISMECGQCHRHKFDPITQKEYYQFFAFFNQTSDPGMQSRSGNQAPLVNVPDAKRDAEITALEQQLAKVTEQISSRAAEVEEPFQQWLAEQAKRIAADAKPQLPTDLLAHFPLDETKGRQAANGADAKASAKLSGKPTWVEGKFGNALKVDGGNFLEAANVGNFERTDGFSYGCWVRPEGNPSGAPLAKMDEANAHRGWDLLLSGGRVSLHLINKWPENAIKVTTKKAIPADQWTHLFATYDGSGKAAGVKIFINGAVEPWEVNEDRLTETTQSQVPLKIGRRNNSSGYKGLVDEVRLYARTLSDTEVAAIAGNDPLGDLLAIPADQRSKEQSDQLRTHYLTTVDAEHQRLTKEKSTLEGQVAALKKQTITCMVMGEQPQPRETFVLMRGHYASPDTSEVIKPGVPSVLPPLPKDAPANRLGLAQWLVAPEHPLTARVAVNRYWSMIFGRGIVATPMDFGSQGAWPTHPLLLDHLAVEFREQGWDIKRIWKEILMSATYRQSSRATPELLARDPENLLLARAPRYRLQGELIRDLALHASGLLVDHVGGPGVKPYQPPGLWNEVSLSGNVRFVQDKGEDLYRKSMYIYWKRSSPHPGMLIMDAPTREKCVVQRPRTNTPLQSLYMMNGVQFVEAARAFAERLMKSDAASVEEKISLGHRLLTAREPTPRVMSALRLLHERQLQKFRGDLNAANELLGVGESPRDATLDVAEHAAWAVVANVLLNMDATLTRH
ncbi:MAG: DUF1553 domain-containing protein [Planctomycetales bacterium]|nr:DUF1553 domain-containing protein [Planctomycetales bacterium]